MSRVEEGNFFEFPHRLVEWKDENGKEHFRLREFKGSSLKLYAALRHFANRFGKKTFYTIDARLMEITGVSKRQLIRDRKILRDLGLIKTYQRPNGILDYEII